MVGQHFGHYRIVRKIGEGGVGHVYLAEDPRLERQVALKILSQANPSPEQLSRFEREAKAAAALNHPNIVAVYDYGHEDSMPYVVMELLAGRNLRDVLKNGALPFRAAFDIASEIVNGLAAAHDKGIAHRDLKPENIFITSDRRVKILDFGLALIDNPNPDGESSDQQRTHGALTMPGVIVGTVGYMAPEQVRGEQVDSRADIFAFGAVLFEMLTGRRAFDEPTVVETMHAILKSDAPLDLLESAGAPPDLVDIVQRCLAKNRVERFESARQIGSALQHVRATTALASIAPDRLDSWKEIAAFLGRGVRTVQRWEREEQLPVYRLPHAKRGSVYADRQELSKWWEQRRTSLASTPAPAAPLQVQTTVASPSPGHLERVTDTSAIIVAPSLSSDARMVVYVSDGGEDATAPQVWLQQVGGAAMRLTSGVRECAEPVFTDDDKQVLFTASDGTLNVYQMPTFGGVPRLLIRNAKGARTSPDGQWLSYISLDPPRRLLIRPRSGGDDQNLVPELINLSCAVWSPDSRYLLVRGHTHAASEADFWIVPIDGRPAVDTGIVRRFKGRATVLDMPPAWVNGSIIIATGTRDDLMLWRQRITAEPFAIVAEPEPLTRGTEKASSPASAAGRLVFVSTHRDINLWSIELNTSSGTAAPPRRITRGPGVMGHLSVTTDGQMLAYFSTRSGPEIYLRSLASGSEMAPLPSLANTLKGFPVLSPSGSRLAYGVVVQGPQALRPIHVVDLRSGVSSRLCEDAAGRPRQWIDERYLLIETFGSPLNAFLSVDTTDGSQAPLLSSTQYSLSNPRVSRDSQWLAFDAAPPGGSPSVYVAPLDLTPLPESAWILIEKGASHPFWSEDGELLYYLPITPNRELRAIIQARRFAATDKRPQGEAFQVISLKELLVPTLIPGAAPVTAGDQVLLVLADIRGDIWMMSL